ncbi:MAG TPA: hypothetical protein VFE57_08640 [Cyclobacteriaceae bacterium]|nr:hypothetical protein [Cyclobacteriaceae bacterium]
MKKYFVITIDVEPDCSPTWHYSNPLTFHGVHEGIGHRLQPLFNKYNVCPTYLINNVVLEDSQSTQTFLNLKGTYELGTHLHAEFMEPQKQFNDYAGKKGESNQCFLEPEVELEKMRNITNLFEANFKKKPTSFRAGRFSAGVNTIKCLETLGYKVDTSVTPHVKWNDKTRKHPVDYISAPEQPYFIKESSYLEAGGQGKILEVPVSIISGKKYFIKERPIWLRPYVSDFRDFSKVIERQSKSFQGNSNIVFNMMFHNVEVMPRLSPYPQTEKECEKYLGALDAFLAFCEKNKIESINLSGLYDVFKRTV